MKKLICALVLASFLFVGSANAQSTNTVLDQNALRTLINQLIAIVLQLQKQVAEMQAKQAANVPVPVVDTNTGTGVPTQSEDTSIQTPVENSTSTELMTPTSTVPTLPTSTPTTTTQYVRMPEQKKELPATCIDNMNLPNTVQEYFPKSGPAGTELTIQGAGFALNGYVRFGKTPNERPDMQGSRYTSEDCQTLKTIVPKNLKPGTYYFYLISSNSRGSFESINKFKFIVTE